MANIGLGGNVHAAPEEAAGYLEGKIALHDALLNERYEELQNACAAKPDNDPRSQLLCGFAAAWLGRAEEAGRHLKSVRSNSVVGGGLALEVSHLEAEIASLRAAAPEEIVKCAQMAVREAKRAGLGPAAEAVVLARAATVVHSDDAQCAKWLRRAIMLAGKAEADPMARAILQLHYVEILMRLRDTAAAVRTAEAVARQASVENAPAWLLVGALARARVATLECECGSGASAESAIRTRDEHIEALGDRAGGLPRLRAVLVSEIRRCSRSRSRQVALLQGQLIAASDEIEAVMAHSPAAAVRLAMAYVPQLEREAAAGADMAAAALAVWKRIRNHLARVHTKSRVDDRLRARWRATQATILVGSRDASWLSQRRSQARTVVEADDFSSLWTPREQATHLLRAASLFVAREPMDDHLATAKRWVARAHAVLKAGKISLEAAPVLEVLAAAIEARWRDAVTSPKRVEALIAEFEKQARGGKSRGALRTDLRVSLGDANLLAARLLGHHGAVVQATRLALAAAEHRAVAFGPVDMRTHEARLLAFRLAGDVRDVETMERLSQIVRSARSTAELTVADLVWDSGVAAAWIRAREFVRAAEALGRWPGGDHKALLDSAPIAASTYHAVNAALALEIRSDFDGAEKLVTRAEALLDSWKDHPSTQEFFACTTGSLSYLLVAPELEWDVRPALEAAVEARWLFERRRGIAPASGCLRSFVQQATARPLVRATPVFDANARYCESMFFQGASVDDDRFAKPFSEMRKLLDAGQLASRATRGRLRGLMAAMHRAKGRHLDAARLYELALGDIRAHFGDEHTEAWEMHMLLGASLTERAGNETREDVRRAVPHYQRAVDLLRRWGRDDSRLADALMYQSFGLGKDGKQKRGIDSAKECIRMRAALLEAALCSEDAGIRFPYLHEVRGWIRTWVNAGPIPAEEIYEGVLLLRGMLWRTQYELNLARQSMGTEEFQLRMREYAALYGEFAGLATREVRDPLRVDAFRARVRELDGKLRTLRAELKGLGDPKRARQAWWSTSLAEIQAKLKKDEALLDYVVWPQRGKHVLTVWVVTQKQVDQIGLDHAAADEAIRGWNKLVSDPPPRSGMRDALEQCVEKGKAVRRHVWDKIASSRVISDRTRHFYVCGHEFIANMNLSALPAEDGILLGKELFFTHLSTPHEVARPAATRSFKRSAKGKSARTGVLLVGAVDYTEQWQDLQAGQDPDSRLDAPTLPHAPVELDALVVRLGRARSLGKVVQLRGAAATEAAIRREARTARVVHLCAHGEARAVLEGVGRASKGDMMTGVFSSARIRAEDPMLSSWLLVRAGEAGEKRDPSDDGVLTALEASHMPLIGADLVVLSACRSAVGDDLGVDGAFGLARGFSIAGARSVVASLWSVADEATAQLMDYFYQELLRAKKTDRFYVSTALWRASHRLRSDDEWNHPYYWAGFVCYGR